LVGLGMFAILALSACGNGPPVGSAGGGGGASDVGSKTTGAAAAKTVEETDQLQFAPTTATVKNGDVVEWDNTGSTAHNVTFDGQAGISSDTMNGGDKFQVKFTRPGSYHYVCTFHAPGMQGTVTVS
jgi:plastocyanin